MPNDPDPDPDPASTPKAITAVVAAPRQRRLKRLAKGYAAASLLMAGSALSLASSPSLPLPSSSFLSLPGPVPDLPAYAASVLTAWAAAAAGQVARAYWQDDARHLEKPMFPGLQASVKRCVLAPYHWLALGQALLKSSRPGKTRLLDDVTRAASVSPLSGVKRLRDQSICIGDLALTSAAQVDGPVLSVCAEGAPAAGRFEHVRMPLLASVPPSSWQLNKAVQEIGRLQALRQGRVRIHGLPGSTRPSLVLAAWLLHSRQALCAEDALQIVQARWPGPTADADAFEALNAWHQSRKDAGRTSLDRQRPLEPQA